MVASSLQGRATVVDRAKVAQLVFQAANQGHSVAPLVLQILMTQGMSSGLVLGGTCSSFLYALRSPEFRVQNCPPLGFMAIGSGRLATEDIERSQDLIFLDNIGHSGVEAWWLRYAVSGYVERKDVRSVGGSYPAIKVRGNTFEWLPVSAMTYKRGTSELESNVDLILDQGRWVQVNRVNGDRLPLQLPWELTNHETRSRVFDYLDSRRDRLYKTP